MTQSHTPALEAIVLAAGRGARFGGDKLLAPLNGAPLVAGALRTALAAPVRRVFVAVGDDPRLVAALEAAAARLEAAHRVVLVPVPNAAEGMGASLRTAAAALPADTAGVFVFLGDMPAIALETPSHLAAVLDAPQRIAVPVLAGRRGHPVLFGADWLPALAKLDGDEGARALLTQAGSRLITVEVSDPGVLLDIDRPEDLARLAQATGAGGRDR
ncbi:nucleotidyltransferase family protein [Caulobacter segnis]|uniref:Molybdopterin-guanine dinucleotide biosynthesis protein A n=2 Tax=Caulobacter segnis TaxID=88688 RepID=D5VDN1_CAUST|nr:nucleotidyltransferase family protein [Caulobacter segnis]ADG08581.1 molybdopterin-guanine dinucleotide biosynthesis protein A [Caulobacter segnis ATCC 21756]AVQ00432.1 nucleotidyltransferase family protein [Caulobacter segnis]